MVVQLTMAHSAEAGIGVLRGAWRWPLFHVLPIPPLADLHIPERSTPYQGPLGSAQEDHPADPVLCNPYLDRASLAPFLLDSCA